MTDSIVTLKWVTLTASRLSDIVIPQGLPDKLFLFSVSIQQLTNEKKASDPVEWDFVGLFSILLQQLYILLLQLLYLCNKHNVIAANI